MKDRRWIDRNTLIDLLKQIPVDAVVTISERRNLVFRNDRSTGYIDFEAELVESLPDREEGL